MPIVFRDFARQLPDRGEGRMHHRLERDAREPGGLLSRTPLQLAVPYDDDESAAARAHAARHADARAALHPVVGMRRMLVQLEVDVFGAVWTAHREPPVQ